MILQKVKRWQPHWSEERHRAFAKVLGDPELFYNAFFAETNGLEIERARELEAAIMEERRAAAAEEQLYLSSLEAGLPHTEAALLRRLLGEVRRRQAALVPARVLDIMGLARAASEMPVSIFLTELEHLGGITSRLARLALGVLPSGDRIARFGLLHAGLKVGAWKVEWADHSLVVPNNDLDVALRAVIDVEDQSLLSRLRHAPVIGAVLGLWDWVVSAFSALFHVGNVRRDRLRSLARVG